MMPCRCLLLASLLVVGCGGDLAEDGSQTVVVPSPTGEQSVFAALDVQIEAWDYESPDYNDLAARESGPPPIRPGLGVHVTINGGVSEGRVPGLEIRADGAPIGEVGSAAFPQSFSYQHYPREPEPFARTLLELRLAGASFALATVPIDAAITSPAAGERIPRDRDVEIRWSGGALSSISVFANHHDKLSTTPCAIQYRQASEGTLFHPEARQPGAAPPCTGEVSATWTSETIAPGPFRSLRLVQHLRRTRRFEVR